MKLFSAKQSYKSVRLDAKFERGNLEMIIQLLGRLCCWKAPSGPPDE